MTPRVRILASALALTLIGTNLAQAATIDSAFRIAVANVLNSVRKDTQYLADMSNAEFKEFTTCAQGVMDGALRPDKQYVLAGKGLSEQRKRFDEIATKVPIDGGLSLKRKITQNCA